MLSRWFPVACAAALLVAAVAYRPQGPEGDREVAGGYTATYRVTDRAGDVPIVHTDTVEVRRPYGGRVETERDGETVTGKITNRELELQLTQGGAVQFAIRRQPGGPLRAISFRALRDAAEAGVIVELGTGTFDGRSCTWFASGAPSPEALNRPGRERVESCVDPSGVLLREVWTIGDRAVRETELVALSTDTPRAARFFEGVDPADIDVTQPEAADILRGQMAVSDDEGLPRPLLRLIGERRRDREAGVVSASPLDGSATQTSSMTFVIDDEVVVVERSVRAGPPPWSEEGSRVDAGPGDGRIVFYASHVEIRIRTNEHGFARIAAPDRRTAEAFAKRLRLPS